MALMSKQLLLSDSLLREGDVNGMLGLELSKRNPNKPSCRSKGDIINVRIKAG